MPREHGAYAEAAFPLVTALALGGIGPAPALLSVAIVCLFLAHEPLMVMIGARGGRARRETGERARRRATILTALALVAGALGLWLAPTIARAAALIPVGFGALLVPLVLKRREKTLLGELIVALALSSALVPVALAGGVELRDAVIASAVWAVIFALATVTVRAVIANAKKRAGPDRMPRAAPLLSAAAIAGVLLLAPIPGVPTLAAAAVLPAAIVALCFGALRIHPRYLRAMGWSLVASNVLALAALLAGLA